MAVGANTYIYFVEIQSPQFDETLKLCNSSGAVFPLDVRWGDFLPIGDALTFDGLQDGTAIKSRNFSFSVRGTNDDLVTILRTIRVADNDVAIYRSTGTPFVVHVPDDPNEPPVTRWLFQDPKVVKLGRVGTFNITGESSTFKCYTAASDLNAVTRTATRWTDTQQRKFIPGASGDYAFKYANRYFRDVGIQTTAGG